MLHILLIDDDESFAKIVLTSLDPTEFSLLTAASGKAGLSVAKHEKPDFILLDEILTDLPGNEVLKLLKSDPETKSIPVAILSDYSGLQMKQPAIEYGALDYIVKYELDMKLLGDKIKQLLHMNS